MAASYRDAQGYIRYNVVATTQKHHPDAEVLTREETTDASYELSVVQRENNRVDDHQGDVNVFSTGISIKVPPNFHAEIYAHPQLYKAGYSLISPLIINPRDNSEIMIPLFKFKEGEDLELPFRAAIVVFRPTVYLNVTASTKQETYEDEEEEVVVPKKKVVASSTTRKTRGARKGGHMF